MPVYIAPIDEYEETFKQCLDVEADIPYPNQLSGFDSHLFSMRASELIQSHQTQLSPAVFDFFNTVFWDWMNDGVRIYETSLDEEAALLNSAIPSSQVSELYQKVSGESPRNIAVKIFEKDDIFQSTEELQNYLERWWSIFETANREHQGVLIHAH